MYQVPGPPEIFQLTAAFGVILVVQDLALPVRGAEDPYGPGRPSIPTAAPLSDPVAAGGLRHPGAVYDGTVMKQIRQTSTLFHYDGPRVFEAQDAIGGQYIAVLASSDGAADRYLVAGVNPERLRLFRSGALDLRSLLVESDEEGRYLATAADGLDHPLTLERLPALPMDSELLPAIDFFLHDRPAADYDLGPGSALRTWARTKAGGSGTP